MGVQFLIPVTSFAMDYIIEPMSGGKRGIKRWGRTLRKIR
jgi:hypothetical protein